MRSGCHAAPHVAVAWVQGSRFSIRQYLLHTKTPLAEVRIKFNRRDLTPPAALNVRTFLYPCRALFYTPGDRYNFSDMLEPERLSGHYVKSFQGKIVTFILPFSDERNSFK